MTFLKQAHFSVFLLGAIFFLSACQDESADLAAEKIPVVVELDIAGYPAGDTPKAIEQAQQALLAKVAETEMDFSVSRTYRMLPHLALSTDGDGLAFLLSQKEVLAVRPDRTVSILSQ
ncbi:hypothetical protein [Aestuariispira insulae]|uniref:Peptidase inhibitor I9 n=1 Tax=Aestuariispira insulae TaxID=1461337 RepID=A0A3D9HX87_9PROT|nr:hypothetical protein [Aestuariispira insulae]RED53991.1 hypothetical protein DFP90_101790 [Aestuariispira insulae]